jgi:FAD synthase
MLSQVANSFIQSPEFLRAFGGLSNEQFVNQLYQHALGRAADLAGFDYHTGNLNSGANSRADVVVGFSESPENQLAVIGVIQNGMTYIAA